MRRKFQSKRWTGCCDLIRQNGNRDAVVYIDGVTGPGADRVVLVGVDPSSLSSENFFFDF